jgi:hypothetical protein
MVEDQFRNLRQQLAEAEIQVPPEPWHAVTSIAVGGLTHIGYAPDSDIILVFSSQGRSVIDCMTGAKLARDHKEFFSGLDESRLKCPGIGPLANQDIRIAGLAGGGLPTCTHDGWRLEALALPWPRYSLFLSQPFKSVLDGPATTTKVGDDGACEYRAHGFSETGRTFVIALSCELNVFSRYPGDK